MFPGRSPPDPRRAVVELERAGATLVLPCHSEFVPMDVFLKRFVTDGTRTGIVEPVNAYNAEDPGMKIVAPLINAAIAD